jgi:hypothetical protein
LEAAPLREIAEWTERYRCFWDERYDRLDSYLQELQQTADPAGSTPADENGGRR